MCSCVFLVSCRGIQRNRTETLLANTDGVIVSICDIVIAILLLFMVLGSVPLCITDNTAL